MNKIEKLRPIKIGQISSSSTTTGLAMDLYSVIPESDADEKIIDKLNEIIDRLNAEL